MSVTITGLDKLQKQMAEAQRVMEEINGELGSVSYDPHDPGSIEGAIAEIGRMIDGKLGPYADNAIIGPMIDGLKQRYREGILEQAAAARLEGDQE